MGGREQISSWMMSQEFSEDGGVEVREDVSVSVRPQTELFNPGVGMATPFLIPRVLGPS